MFVKKNHEVTHSRLFYKSCKFYKKLQNNTVPPCSRSQMFFKIGILRNFEKFHRKTPVLESLFNKVKGLEAKLAKFLRTPFFREHLRWLLQYPEAKSLANTHYQ